MASRFIGRRVGLAAALLFLSATGVAAGAQPEAAPAMAAFEQARSLCEADGGRAWGVSLCGPMLIADPATRAVIASMDGLETPLEREGTVFRGCLPDEVPIANTAVRWNGRVWTMLVAPLPKDEPGRSILLMHEAWHRIQDQIGLKALNADQPQLATEAGRASLRLELRALAAALGATDPAARRVAVEDALTFRAWRHARFPEAQAAEDALERNEGLAEYTGRLLSRDGAMIPHLAEHLGKGDRVREYATATGRSSGVPNPIVLRKAGYYRSPSVDYGPWFPASKRTGHRLAEGRLLGRMTMSGSGALLTLAVGSACLAPKLHLLNAEPVIKIEPSGERRRVWSDAEKAAILEEAFAPGANTSEVGRRYGVSSGLIYTWRATALARLPMVAAAALDDIAGEPVEGLFIGRSSRAEVARINHSGVCP
ncbi:transposase [Brevundimonas diminuta]|uniref:transposase n=1 Tax=Brevundimonas diminuta TaxID=293 RepID=UPI0020973BFA|nr:transposase [Brevundimonas diminuta]MCO8029328.1 transposase [Brevundimonas diminuta]